MENKSSLVPNAGAGLVDDIVVFVGLGPDAHPPNSSSAATFGNGLKPPVPPDTTAWPPPSELGLPGVLPQPRSAAVAADLFTTGDAALWLAVAAGSGEAQALEPHTSEVDQLAVIWLGSGEAANPALTIGGGGDDGWAADRLKTEDEASGGREEFGLWEEVAETGAGAGSGAERSNRLLMADGCVGATDIGWVDDIGASSSSTPSAPRPVDVDLSS